MFLGINSMAQEKSHKEIKGDKYAFNYSYHKAIYEYTHAKDLTIEGQRKLAEGYQKTGQNDQATLVYSKIVSASTGINAEDYYNYSMLLKSSGMYQESNTQMDKFAKLKPSDLRAKDYVANKANLADLLKDNGKYKLVHMDFNSNVQDFATSYYKDQIVFASTRANGKMIKRTYNLNGMPFLDMYVSEVEKGQLKNPHNFDNGMNFKLHDGPVSFNKEGTFMAFTRNHKRDESKDNVVELQIFFSQLTDGKWSGAFPFAQNNEGYNLGHPSLSADGKTMYFTSDMPGGFGGTDLYRTNQSEAGQWTKAENLGNQINTEGDEMFPFMEDSTHTLFFSSNGRFGLGGQDIFMAKMNNKGFDQVHNAGAPLNTQFDDFAAIADGKTNTGYFSSNRAGESNDVDIYTVEFLNGLDEQKRIEGLALDKNGIAIPKTFISLLDDKGNRIDTLTTKEDASYAFVVNNDKNYKLIGKKENYSDGENTFNTFGDVLTLNANVLLLTKKEIITKKNETETDLGKIVELKNLYFDLDKYNLRPDAVVELDKVVKIMNEHPNLVLEIRSYTDCRESITYNLKLSEKRAKTSAWYIKARVTHPDRITSKGFGESELTNNCSCAGDVISDCSEEEHQKNRRSEFVIVKTKDGKKSYTNLIEE